MISQGSETASRRAHNPETAGSTPAPATSSRGSLRLARRVPGGLRRQHPPALGEQLKATTDVSSRISPCASAMTRRRLFDGQAHTHGAHDPGSISTPPYPAARAPQHRGRPLPCPYERGGQPTAAASREDFSSFSSTRMPRRFSPEHSLHFQPRGHSSAAGRFHESQDPRPSRFYSPPVNYDQEPQSPAARRCWATRAGRSHF